MKAFAPLCCNPALRLDDEPYLRVLLRCGDRLERLQHARLVAGFDREAHGIG